MKHLPLTLAAVLALVATPVLADEIGPGRGFDDGDGRTAMTATTTMDAEQDATGDAEEEASLLDYFMGLIK